MRYLLDTSALKWAYLDGSRFCRRIRYIITRFRGNIFIAEISVVEIVSALGHEVRGKRLSIRNFLKANVRFLRDVAEGRIKVLRLPSSELIACRDLLVLVGIHAGRNLMTQDAIVAYAARRLALERAERVRLLTRDRTLANIVNQLPVFQHLVEAVYLGA